MKNSLQASLEPVRLILHMTSLAVQRNCTAIKKKMSTNSPATSLQMRTPNPVVGTKNHATKPANKRKATQALPSTEAKIMKTEISIKKLNENLEKKTCPKTLRYSARANIPADEDFTKDIKTIKEKAEQGFIRTLRQDFTIAV